MVPDWFVRAGDRPEFWTGERCFITELMNDPAEPAVSLAVARVEPGVTTQLHRLDGVTERYVVRKGRGIVEVDSIQQRLETGDQALIPAGAAQRIENDGDTDLEFYCVCTPRFFPESYIDLETRGNASA